MSKGIWKRKSNSKKGKSGNVLKGDIRARKILIQRVGRFKRQQWIEKEKIKAESVDKQGNLLLIIRLSFIVIFKLLSVLDYYFIVSEFLPRYPSVFSE